MKPIDVVLPCLNEAVALPVVLAKIPPGFRALVVDNGSTDDSADVAVRLGAHVVREARPGYGAAVHCGILAAKSDVVCVLDADDSLDPADLVGLVALLADADLVVGRRVPAVRGAWPWHARVANALLSLLLRIRGVQVHDIAPIRVFRRQAVLDLAIEDRRFGYPLELLLRAGQKGWRITEADVPYFPRAVGTKSKVTGSIRGTARAIKDMAGVLR
jgi:glycosyltransferase involved in cell wall biosynthesis